MRSTIYVYAPSFEKWKNPEEKWWKSLGLILEPESSDLLSSVWNWISPQNSFRMNAQVCSDFHLEMISFFTFFMHNQPARWCKHPAERERHERLAKALKLFIQSTRAKLDWFLWKERNILPSCHLHTSKAFMVHKLRGFARKDCQ